MKVNVHVRDKHYPIFCGNGSQKVRWLSDVALHRYEHFEATDPGLAKGMRYENGQLVDMDCIITDKLENDVHVWVILKEDLALMEAEQAKINQRNQDWESNESSRMQDYITTELVMKEQMVHAWDNC